MRGRPKKYASDEERKVAHAAAKREKRKRAKEARERRHDARNETQKRRERDALLARLEPTDAFALRLRLFKAIDEKQPIDVISKLCDQMERAEEVEESTREYDAQIRRQAKREQKTAVKNSEEFILPNGERITITGLDPMNRGKFLTDAEQGKGLPVVGLIWREGSPIEPLVNSDNIPLRRRRARNGFGKRPQFSVEQEMLDFVNKHCNWDSVLKCHHPGCRKLVVGVFPQDGDKPALEARYYCERHPPTTGFVDAKTT